MNDVVLEVYLFKYWLEEIWFKYYVRFVGVFLFELNFICIFIYLSFR